MASGATYRVVGVQADGQRIFIQGNLIRDVAESVKRTMLVTFPEVLIEDERLPVSHSDQTTVIPENSGQRDP